MRPTATAGRALCAAALSFTLIACKQTPTSTPTPTATSTPTATTASIATPAASLSAPFARLVAALASAATVAPRPDLPGSEGAAAAEARSPRLTGRTVDGKVEVDFPLRRTRVVAQVSGNVARVEVTQYFANPSPTRLEAIYAFPLPPDAAVTDMWFRIGRRVVASEVHRREEARRVYEAAREEGRTAALTEQERPNLFTQSVANVPPGETVAVVLRYVHEVPLDDGRYLFHFPTTIGPRYVPGVPAPGASGPGWAPDTDRVPDASRVSPPVVAEGERSSHDLDLVVRLVPGAAFDDVAARSHRVVTGLDAEGARVVALAEDDRVPNKDFVLSWRAAGAEPEAHALVQRERGEDFLLLFAQPPAEVEPEMVRPKELVFLLDKSGSMMGAPIERAKALIVRALHAMGPDDTFQIVAFDGGAEAMSASPLASTPGNVARAEGFLAALHGGGGTEMLEGIRAALVPPEDPRRLRMVVFCTDGFIGNEAEIIEAVEDLRGSARVFGFGIGTSVNRFLVEGVGRAGRGAAEVVDLREPLEPAVARLFRRLDRPVLTDLSIAFEGGEVRDLLPARLPDLFAGQPLAVVGRVAGGAPTHAVLRGRLGEAPWERRIAIRSQRVAEGASGPDALLAAQPAVGTLWARRRIEELLSARPTHLRGLLGMAPRPPGADAVEDAIALALRFKLVTAHTSFVAVERELLADASLPLERWIVPNEMPEGVSHEGIFGPATVHVTPMRVKPGDPEIRVAAAPSARAVLVTLPFEDRPRDALRDAASGEWVVRFLVPPGWPDGSYDARIVVMHAGGAREERVAHIRVDTAAAAVAVLSSPERVRPGQELRLSLKPALPVGRASSLLGHPGGLGNALKGAMEVKEILVRAPWGEIARARMEGPLGAWTAALRVPADAAPSRAELEIVASDAAGNVSRRRLAVEVGPVAAPEAEGDARQAAPLALLAALALLALAFAARALLRARPAPPLAAALLAGAVEGPRPRGRRS